MFSKIKAIRMQQGMTQKQIAERMGCHPATYAQVEQGRRVASARLQAAITEALGEKWADEKLFDDRGLVL
jgi:transcriptional regulator with XRE-family HTH domain